MKEQNQISMDIVNPKAAGIDIGSRSHFVAIGQKEGKIARVVEQLRNAGAMDYTIVVSSSASTPASMQYLAPYAGCAM